jgi:dTDP-4-dehydrorhamnose 3,5-epimerase
MKQEKGKVSGINKLLKKQSAVGQNKLLKQPRIDGVELRFIRPVSHEDGTLSEIARVDWEEISKPIVHVHVSTTLPGRIRAWGLHQNSTDRLFVVKGLVSIVVYDGRTDSRTFGLINEFKISERNPALLVIPSNLYHGWKVLGTDEAFVINMPTSMYDYDHPDALDLPYESADAMKIIPYRW